MFVFGDVVYAQTWQVLTLKNCIEPFSYASTAYVVASALATVRLFCKNLGKLQKFFGQMVYRTPWQKNSPYAYEQKGTAEFFQDENPPLFVDASVRYTESKLDHRSLANDRRYICVCYSCGWMVFWSNAYRRQDETFFFSFRQVRECRFRGAGIFLFGAIRNPRNSSSKESKSGIQAPLTRKAKKLIGIEFRGLGIHRLKYRIQGYLGLPYKYMGRFL